MGSYTIFYEIGEAPNRIHVCKKMYAAFYSVSNSTIDSLISDIKNKVVETRKPFSDSTAAATPADIVNASGIGCFIHFPPLISV